MGTQLFDAGVKLLLSWEEQYLRLGKTQSPWNNQFQLSKMHFVERIIDIKIGVMELAELCTGVHGQTAC